ncbi:MAG TPA: LpqB family beta-propeller domain-containing protein [Bryobacteraceae bacterium]|nr:LpqB family beta-propeller domain-containing protein [Bryobacteraceae bacterium]
MIGQRLLHYQIVEKLGEGGMGVVYKARDTHLDRFVAIKVLPAGKVADADRKGRFVQEAKAASALNHPNIVHVYDIAAENGVDFIAMEFVDGKTLDQAIPRKGMRVGEALKIAVQIADALAAAHAGGIVHRDLKPANVMVTGTGLVKVLDFGLAKLQGPDSRAQDEETRTMRTHEGVIVGTAAFMSPEQAESRPVDARSDIFSFGCVLYEMATGSRAFRGDTTVSTLSAVLREEPKPPRQLVDDLPQELERIILRCLRKDPARRFQGMADLKVALEELKAESESGTLSGPEPARPKRRKTAWIVVAAAAVVLAAAGVWTGRRWQAPAAQAIPPVPLTSYAGMVNDPAFSPDGNQVAFAWNGEKQDNIDIYIKLLGPGTPLRLTTNPLNDRSPAWSPDGRQIAFYRNLGNSRGAIMLVPALGGSERTVAEGAFVPGLAWSQDGQSLFLSRRETPDGGHGIFVLSVNSGDMRRLTQPSAEAWAGDVTPAISPDGRTLAFARALTRSNSEIYLLSLNEKLEAKGEPRRLTFENRASGRPAWTPDGKKVVFSSGGAGATSVANLMVIPASASGEKAEPVAGGEGGEAPTISRQGKLVYMHWVRDENIWRLPLANGKPGTPERFIFSTRRDIEPRFSADGKKLAFTTDRSGPHEVWLCDADGSNQTQLTSMGGTMTGGARWSPDGQRIAFLSNQEGQQEIYLTTPNGGAPLRLTNNPAHDSAPSWSRDGKWIYFTSNRQDGFQVWKMPPDPTATPVRVTRNGGYGAIESADGKTLYYSKRDDRATWALWKVPLEGGEETMVIPKIATWGDFDVTDAGIYYIDSDRAGAKLLLRRFAGGSDTVLGTLEKRVSFGLSASPDNRAVLYTRYDQESTELMLVENSAR